MSDEFNNYEYDEYPLDRTTRYDTSSQRGQGLAIASLTLGIISIVMALSCCLSYISIVPAIAGIICGILSKNESQKRNGCAIAGIICSAIAAIIFIIVVLLTVFTQFSYINFFDDDNSYYDSPYDNFDDDSDDDFFTYPPFNDDIYEDDSDVL